ncbi:MAG: biotin--[acetyl-CoA-carboxylase] ligase [Elainellaceae cyanobacterium]
MEFNLALVQQALDRYYLQETRTQNLLKRRNSGSAIEAIELPIFPALQIYCFESVTSTNTAVWDLLSQGARAGTVAIALTQQAGRGQRGKQWVSNSGGLYLSIGLAPNLSVHKATQLTLSSAWGIAQVLRDRSIPVQIKWLNDLVVQGRKLGGILTETRSYQGRIHQAVVGVGINWSNSVPEVGVNLKTVLSEVLAEPARSPANPIAPDLTIASLEQLAATVLWGIRTGYELWRQQGTAALISAYETLLANRGDVIDINDRPGTVVGITATGQLRVYLQPSQDQTLKPQAITLDPGSISLGYRFSGGCAECDPQKSS